MVEPSCSRKLGLTSDEVLTGLTSALHKEHADLKDWFCLRLADQKTLLVEQGLSLERLREQFDDILGSISPMPTPSRPERTGSEDWAPIMPAAPDMGWKVRAIVPRIPRRGSCSTHPLDMSSSRYIVEGCHLDEPTHPMQVMPTHPMQVPEKCKEEDKHEKEDAKEEEEAEEEEEHNIKGKSLSERWFPSRHDNRTSTMDMADRAEWNQHLQRQVTAQLEKKKRPRSRRRNLSRKSSCLPRESDNLEDTQNRWLPEQLASCLLHIAESMLFQWASAGVIVINMCILGYATEVGMANALTRPPTPDPVLFKTLDVVFTSIYFVELLVRILAYGWRFASGPDRTWNAFDTLLIVLSIVEYCVQDVEVGVSTLRLVRALRLFRVLRIFCVIRYFRDIRLMVCSICQSLGAVSWALLLLGIIMYVFSIVFMQGSILYLRTEYEDGFEAHDEVRHGLERWYSSLFNTLHTLLASITSGISWADAVRPLEHISMVYRWLYSSYIVFVVIGILNVLTGIFVERACELSGMDKDLVIQTQMTRNEAFLNEMERIFDEADRDGSGTVSWREFKEYLAHDRVKAYLSAQQLDAFDARTLFHILSEGTGNDLSIEQFIVGCQRLKGMARSVDVVALLQETRSANRRLKALTRSLNGGSPGGLQSPTSNRSRLEGRSRASSCSSSESEP